MVQRGYNFVFHGCGTSRSRMRQNKSSPKTHPVEQRVPLVLSAPNVRRNASTHSSIPSHVPNGTPSHQPRTLRSCHATATLHAITTLTAAEEVEMDHGGEVDNAES
ncbi:hypothetical protein DVH24_042249 [Malus domestica]|uniref:Uncharacterized protein n=1 Tax=Malus domestica TaxID=3750 RepID=A0A498IXX0_MALDO|nr:hypothetical protein DVH24_042249 [Malus domestica]